MSVDASPSSTQGRFEVLDGVRGLAALAVMVFHHSYSAGMPLFRTAWTAVDAFFILSGFVLAHGYGARIQSGQLGLSDFLRVRAIRLAPLYLLGSLLGLAVFIAGHGPSATEIATTALLGFCLIPTLAQTAQPAPIFPLNEPSWTLFFEAFVNVVFFFWASKAKAGRPWLVAAIALICYFLLYRTNTVGLHGGWGNTNFLIGFPRVTYHFFAGVIIYRVHQKLSGEHAALGLLLIALMFYLFAAPFGGAPALNAFIVAPLVVLVNARAHQGGARLGALHVYLGQLSYPLYVTHVPIFHALSLSPAFAAMPPWGQLALGCAVSVVAAHGLIDLDAAVRRRLSRRRPSLQVNQS